MKSEVDIIPADVRWLDFRRSRASTSHSNTIKHEKRTRRSQCRGRHPVRTPSRNFRLNGAPRKNRIHPRTSSPLHRKARLDPSRHPQPQNQHPIFLPQTQEISRAARKGAKRARRTSQETSFLRSSSARGKRRRRHGPQTPILRTTNHPRQTRRQIPRHLQTLPPSP